MVWETGLEPVFSRIQTAYVDQLHHSQIMVPASGFEPTEGRGRQIYSLLRLTASLYWHMAPEVGLEPTSRSGGLTVLCVYQFRHSGINY